MRAEEKRTQISVPSAVLNLPFCLGIEQKFQQREHKGRTECVTPGEKQVWQAVTR